MAHYMQREIYLSQTIPSGQIVPFDYVVSESLSTEEINGDDYSTPDFNYHYDGNYYGAVDILRKGDYLILWQIEQLSERPIERDFFSLKLWIDSTINPRWEMLGTKSSHLKATNHYGLAIFSKENDEVSTIALFNDSGEQVNINKQSDPDSLRQLGRLVIFGLSEDDGDFSNLLELIELDSCCTDIYELLDKLKKITLRQEHQYTKIEELQVKYVELSNDYQFLSAPPTMARWPLGASSGNIAIDGLTMPLGLFLCCKRVGYVHSLWIEGSSSFTLSPSRQYPGYHLLRSDKMPMLNEYGETYYPFRDRFPAKTGPILGPCWIYNGNNNPQSFIFMIMPPVSTIDTGPTTSGVVPETVGGLRVRATSNTPGTTFRFNVSIALSVKYIYSIRINMFEGDIDVLSKIITFSIPSGTLVAGAYTGVITQLEASEDYIILNTSNTVLRYLNDSITIRDNNEVFVEPTIRYKIKILEL